MGEENSPLHNSFFEKAKSSSGRFRVNSVGPWKGLSGGKVNTYGPGQVAAGETHGSSRVSMRRVIWDSGNHLSEGVRNSSTPAFRRTPTAAPQARRRLRIARQARSG